VLRGHTEYAVTLAWVPHTPYALSGSNDGSVRVWDTETSRCIKTLEGHKGDVRSVEWNEHGHCALSGDSKGLIRRWSLPDLSTDPR
jgi:WD40 repeat protein